MPFDVPVVSGNHCLWWKPQWKPLVAMSFDSVDTWATTRAFTTLARKVGMGAAVRAQWWLRTGCELIVQTTGANLLAASSARCVSTPNSSLPQAFPAPCVRGDTA